ncbi:MAG TPA: hypothetical protein VL494_21110 [Steroidobacteraceae bacterium]|nr:hypothetical protein [Steroidobacteraceae bacterium]
MPVGTILFVIVVGAGIAMMVFLFVGGAGPDWMWVGGRNNPLRNLLFRPDGSWRRYGKVGVVTFWLLIAISAYFS